MTEFIFRTDPYAKSCEATITAIGEHGIELDRTVFYPMGGGQPGDSGVLRPLERTGAPVPIENARKGAAANSVLHVPAEQGGQLALGTRVSAEIDWARRHRLMRVHSCLHLLSAVLPYPVTGGQVGDGKGRLDFDIPESILDKDEIAAQLNALVAAGHEIESELIDDEELESRPELVKTMAVKPPVGQGKVRLIRISGLDLQPCGGTHVASTAEIGEVVVTKIQKKGRLNRRVSIELVDPTS
jgi:misacylated tRNA(Ala) deacylase